MPVDLIECSYTNILIKMQSNVDEKEPSIRINCVIRGDPARWLYSWKRRGLVKSNSDAVRQSFRVFHEKIVEQDLQEERLERLKQ